MNAGPTNAFAIEYGLGAGIRAVEGRADQREDGGDIHHHGIAAGAQRR